MFYKKLVSIWHNNSCFLKDERTSDGISSQNYWNLNLPYVK